MRPSSFNPHDRLDRADLGVAACGGLYGAGLARYLFESNPQRLLFFGAWSGTLLLAFVCGGTILVLSKTRPILRPSARPAPFAPLALLLPLISLLSPDVNLLRAQTLLLGSLALFVILNFFTPQIADTQSAAETSRRPIRVHPFPLEVGGWVLGFLLFLLYLRTLAPAVGTADTFEFQVGIARLGIAHGSGYPLLMLLGKLFTLLPVGGTLAFRANLTSAFFGALAGVGVERLARRLGASPLSALLAGFTFGVSPTLWSRAVEVEAYTLNAALVASILYLCLELFDAPHASRFTLHALAFLFGLSLTNHLTTLVLAPACLAAVLIAYGRWRIANRLSPVAAKTSSTPHASRLTPHVLIRYSLSAILFCLLGLSVYLYLPLRWPAVNHGELLSFARFVNILSGNEAKGAFALALPFADFTRYAIVLRKIVEAYGWAGSALALAGALALVFRRPPPPIPSPVGTARSEGGSGWPMALILALAYAGYTYFALAFNVPDPDFSAFFIPMHLIAAVLMGVGLQAILNAQFALLNSKSLFHLTFCLLPSAFCILPLRSLWLTLPRVDKSRDWSQYRLGAYLLNQPLAQGATILADSQKIAPLYYLQVAEGVRPDLDIMVLPDEESYRAVLDEHLAAGQAVYLGRYLPGLGNSYSLRSVGPLAEASSKPFTTSVEIAHPLATRLASKIRLLGYDIDKAHLSAPGSLGLTLFWRTDTPVVENYLVSLRLVDASEQVAWQNSGSVPVSNLYPTNAWRPGEVISDFYSVPIKAALAPGEYRLEAGLFPPFQVSTDAGWAEIAPITILPTAEPPSPLHLLRAQIGSQWLMGYQSPESVAPGSRLTVTLYWLHTRESETVTAFGETRSLAAWPLEQIVPQEYKLTTPTTGRRFDLVVDNGTSARCGWLAPIMTSCLLAPIQLAGEAIADDAINFDNQILLTRPSLDTPIVAPGGQAEVTLHWQGLQTIAEDYTVFVHLLGPDGLVHGQVDAWPVSGTQATSQWKPGEKIEDHYRIQVPADAPPGEYTVEVGLYLLATLERLPVLNAEGAPVDDKVLITGLTVGS